MKAGRRIIQISDRFLNVKYVANTLIGSVNQPEELAINLEAVDCMTFIEYVEALRLSRQDDDFVSNLKLVRYVDGEVSYFRRRHFFTDWAGVTVNDVTGAIGKRTARKIDKLLNVREDGSLLLPGIRAVERTIYYIGPEALNDSVFALLSTGDYVGIYTNMAGLDVTHTGLLIKTDESRLLLRHASMKHGKVVDEDFVDYAISRPGLIVLRPLDDPFSLPLNSTAASGTAKNE